jgi:threonine/homoserine/homoserine lactone efflux protein
VWPQILALGALFVTTGFFITAAYGAAAGVFGQALGRAAGWLGKISAVVFAGLAARLVLD